MRVSPEAMNLLGVNLAHVGVPPKVGNLFFWQKAVKELGQEPVGVELVVLDVFRMAQTDGQMNEFGRCQAFPPVLLFLC